MTQAEEGYLGVQEFAKLLNVSPQTVYSWIDDEFIASKVEHKGRVNRYFIPRDQVEVAKEKLAKSRG